MAIPKSDENPRKKKPRIPKSETQQSSTEQESTEDIEQYKKRIAALEAQLAQKQVEEDSVPESMPTVETEGEQKAKPKRKPVKKKKAPEQEVEQEPESDEDDEWETHPRTGVKYRKIPPAKLDADGIPLATITDDIDLMDFNDSAQQFLAHLQVAPSQKEQQRMREEREKRAQQAQAKFEEKWKDYKRPKPKAR